ncbi:MAG TPA: aminodeoxychorismate/anthranilate synthase component II [Gemmatimonadales bacterium]|nr:aminodeoxychorismate/anthranilate synthase component II [Gemmatimonadales bacterium]
MLFVLDNYDSFTWNLVQYLGELGAEPVVRRNDELTTEEVLQLAPERIVISPGPGEPAAAGIAVPLIRAAAASGVPLLGVCLGHQAIGEAFGGRVVRARRLMHGKTSEVRHTGEGVLSGLPSPFTAMRYHSLVVEEQDLPAVLEPIAWSADEGWGGELMAVRHRSLPIHGVQFHPESIGTPAGKDLLRNFLSRP